MSIRPSVRPSEVCSAVFSKARELDFLSIYHFYSHHNQTLTIFYLKEYLETKLQALCLKLTATDIKIPSFAKKSFPCEFLDIPTGHAT